jgi:hypothetical protein
MKDSECSFENRFVKRGSDCWEWTGRISKWGYGLWYVRNGGNRPNKLAHRFAYELAKGPIPKGLCVCHSCDNRLCVNPDHLWLGTLEENNHDRDAKGRTNRPIGENHPRAKLDLRKVRMIRRLRGKVTQSRLAKHFGVSPSTIASAQKGVNWFL